MSPREKFIDKVKLVFFVLLFFVAPVVVIVALDDGSPRSSAREDWETHFRR